MTASPLRPPPQFAVFEDAYLHYLATVRDAPEFRNAPRGHRSRELIGIAYRLSNPRERAIRNLRRRSNIVFNFAEVLWYLSGSNSLEMIAHYAPSIRKYSSDGISLRGTAYGPRIFQFGGAAFDQWNSVINTLRDDPDSKRAFIQIFAPEELLLPGNIDVACTIGLQFLIRDEALHAVGFMRANDAFRGTVSDVFSFTVIQELLANQLGLRLGTYTHCVGSYHLYAVDDPWAHDVLTHAQGVSREHEFPAMPRGDNWPYVRQVLELEYLLRRQRERFTDADIKRLDLPEYWQQIVALFALHSATTPISGQAESLMTMLHPLYREMYRNVVAHRRGLDAGPALVPLTASESVRVSSH